MTTNPLQDWLSSQAQAAPTPAPQPAPTVQNQFPNFDMTEDGNANLVEYRAQGRIRFVTNQNVWLIWDGTRFSDTYGEAEVVEFVTSTIRSIPNDPTWGKHRAKSLSAQSIKSTIKLLSAKPSIRARAEDFDADPYILNTPDGVVDLRSGRLLENDPSFMCRKITNVGPAPIQKNPLFLKFFHETLGSQSMVDFLQRALGMSIIGEVRDSRFFMAYGSGANGKTTLLEAVSRTLNSGSAGYALNTGPELFLTRKSDRNESALIDFKGARLIIASEANRGDVYDEARVKRLSGGDTLEGRGLYEKFQRWAPTHTIWMMTNFKPEVSGGGHSFWRRMRQIDFPNVVEADRIDVTLPARLDAERGQILQWILDGVAIYLKDGLREPEEVLRATTEYARESDTIKEFLENQTYETDGSDKVLLERLYNEYFKYTRESVNDPQSKKVFKNALATEYGYVVRRSTGNKLYVFGLALNKDIGWDDDEKKGGSDED